jgi:glycosyltransferase involved in cell wall biosynthesis
MMGGGGGTIFHAEASSGWGGQELRILAELEGLAGRGYRTGLICEPNAPIGDRARALGRPVHAVRFRWSGDPAAIRQVAGILRRERADVLGTHSSLDAWVGGIAARFCGVPVVRTRHLDLPLKRNPLSRAVYRLLADTIVVTGASGAARLVAESGVSPARVHVVPTGIDLARFDPTAVDGSRIRRELGFPPGVPVVGTIGVLRALKGPDVFLRGCRIILDKIPATRFLMAGDGPLRREVRDMQENLGLAEAMHLLGHREDVPELLAALDVFVLSSLGSEINPQAVSQAMVMGVPVVASALPGVSEMAREGETALLFPPGDVTALAAAVCQMLTDESARRALAARAQAEAREHCGLERMLDRMERIYLDEMARCRGGSAGRIAPRAADPGEAVRR